MHQITGEDEETITGDKEEDPLPEKMCPLQGMEAPLDVSTAEKKDIMPATALRRSSYHAMRRTIGKPISLTYKMKRNRTNAMITKCMTSKKWTQWCLSALN